MQITTCANIPNQVQSFSHSKRGLRLATLLLGLIYLCSAACTHKANGAPTDSDQTSSANSRNALVTNVEPAAPPDDMAKESENPLPGQFD